jgi:hypothetical protein
MHLLFLLSNYPSDQLVEHKMHLVISIAEQATKVRLRINACLKPVEESVQGKLFCTLFHETLTFRFA